MSQTTFTINRDDLSVTLSRLFNASPETVWRSMTEAALIPKWWGPERYTTVVDKMDLQVGGSWRFLNLDAEGNEFAFYGEYLAIEPPHRLVQTFNFEPLGPGHASVETAVLETVEAGKTRLTVTAVYKTLADLNGSVEGGMEGGARETWQRLADLVVAESLVISISRVFNAPVSRVWQAWSDPLLMARWLGPEGFTARVDFHDFREGGHWRQVFIGPDGSEYPSEGIYKEIVQHEKIVTTDDFGDDFKDKDSADLPSGMITTVLFEDLGARTRLTARLSHQSLEEKRKHEEMDVIAGWESMLNCLEQLLLAIEA